jgi:hypothetical protein
MALSIIGPGAIGGLGILFGLPAAILLLLTAGLAGFTVAYPGGGHRFLSAYAGLGANFVSFVIVTAPYVPSLLGDVAFRQAAAALAGLVAPVVVVGLGLGALVGYGGGWVGRDVARRSADPR